MAKFDAQYGLAVAGLALATNTIKKLHALGHLSNLDVHQIHEDALRSLELFPGANDPGVGEARIILDEIAKAWSAEPSPKHK
jgi:hypothetical protein